MDPLLDPFALAGTAQRAQDGELSINFHVLPEVGRQIRPPKVKGVFVGKIRDGPIGVLFDIVDMRAVFPPLPKIVFDIIVVVRS